MSNFIYVLATVMLTATNASAEILTSPQTSITQLSSIEARLTVAPEDLALYFMVSGSGIKPSDKVKDETRFFETFYQDGRWSRTDYMAAPINKRGRWAVKALSICVIYNEEEICRKVRNYNKNNIVMESWRTKLINNYAIYNKIGI